MGKIRGSPICVNREQYETCESIPIDLFGVEIEGTTTTTSIVDHPSEKEIFDHRIDLEDGCNLVVGFAGISDWRGSIRIGHRIIITIPIDNGRTGDGAISRFDAIGT